MNNNQVKICIIIILSVFQHGNGIFRLYYRYQVSDIRYQALRSTSISNGKLSSIPLCNGFVFPILYHRMIFGARLSSVDLTNG